MASAMTAPQSPPPPPPPPHPQTSQSMPMLLPILIIFLLFVCFLSIFLFQDLFHCLRRGQRRRNARSNNSPAGLDPTIISSFPTLPFSAIRRLQEGKCGAECAVCLSEFSDGGVIRLLTVCCHVFHPACIDSWLALHTTCPICRSDLEAPPDEAAVLAVQEAVGIGIRESHVISLEDEIKTSSREVSVENEERREGKDEVQ